MTVLDKFPAIHPPQIKKFAGCLVSMSHGEPWTHSTHKHKSKMSVSDTKTTSANAVITSAKDTETPKVKVSRNAFKAFVTAIIEGTPTAGLLPARISDCDLSEKQREEIRQARKTHEANTKAQKAVFLRRYKAKRYDMTSHKTNAHGDIANVRFRDEEAIAKRRKAKAALRTRKAKAKARANRKVTTSKVSSKSRPSLPSGKGKN